MPHLHLSLQSGDDMILKRMKRRHLRDDAIRFCERLRRCGPMIVFGADIIAGFPTETEEMFANSLGLAQSVRRQPRALARLAGRLAPAGAGRKRRNIGPFREFCPRAPAHPQKTRRNRRCDHRRG
jgi:radical SAM superfamily enzyme YgiQ (UPF0313 family)